MSRDPAVYIILLLACAVFFTLFAGSAPVAFKGDENFYYESAAGMVESGNYLMPVYRGEERFQKPILFYWLVALSFKLFGVSWFSARLVSAAAASLTVLLTFAAGRLLFDDAAALIAAGLLATTSSFFRYARLAVPEAALLFFVTLALCGFAHFYFRGRRASYYLIPLGLGLGFLVKGPVAVIVPLCVIFMFPFFVKERRQAGALHILLGMILFAAIAAPWLCAAIKAYGKDYLAYVLDREVVQRVAGCGKDACLFASVLQGGVFYLFALVTRFFPYSALLPFAALSSRRLLIAPGGAAGSDGKRKAAHTFIIVWFVTVFVFFSFMAERRTHYLLMLSPALALWTAALFSERRRYGRIAAALLITLCAASYLIAVKYAPPGLLTNNMGRAAALIRASMKTGDRIGIGSHGIIPEKLQVYFGEKIVIVHPGESGDMSHDAERSLRLRGFLSSEGRVFCVMKRSDYERYVPEDLKRGLAVLDKYFVWKRRFKFDKGAIISFLEGDKYALRNWLQNEIYVVTNKQ